MLLPLIYSKNSSDRLEVLGSSAGPILNDSIISLTNLQFAFKFICRFSVGEYAFRSDKVENLIVVIIVIDVTSNQLGIPYHTFYIRSTY